MRGMWNFGAAHALNEGLKFSLRKEERMKKIIRLICVFAVVLTLFGCGEKPSEPEEPKNEIENVDEEKMISELTKYDWINTYRGLFIYEFDEDGTFEIYAYRNNTGDPDGVKVETDDAWIPTAENMEPLPYLEGTWKIEGNSITLKNATEYKNVKVEMYFKGEEGYEKYNNGGYEGNAIIYESSYVKPEDEFEANTSSPFYLFRLGEKAEEPEEILIPLNSWRGVYVYDDGNYGEVLIIEASDEASVTGKYIFGMEDGSYGIRDLTLEIMKDNLHLAREPFQNGKDYVYYRTGDNELIVDYPEAWWQDRHFVYRSSIEDIMTVIKHPMLGNAEARPEPFYGIWTMGSKAESDAVSAADKLKSQGFAAKVYMTTDWSNLNKEPWYVVSAGEYASESEAEKALTSVKNAGYSTAYVKFTGDYIK